MVRDLAHKHRLQAAAPHGGRTAVAITRFCEPGAICSCPKRARYAGWGGLRCGEGPRSVLPGLDEQHVTREYRTGSQRPVFFGMDDIAAERFELPPSAASRRPSSARATLRCVSA